MPDRPAASAVSMWALSRSDEILRDVLGEGYLGTMRGSALRERVAEELDLVRAGWRSRVGADSLAPLADSILDAVDSLLGVADPTGLMVTAMIVQGGGMQTPVSIATRRLLSKFVCGYSRDLLSRVVELASSGDIDAIRELETTFAEGIDR